MVDPHEGTISLNHSFSEAYDWLSSLGQLSLVTNNETDFVALTSIVTKGGKAGKKVIRFFQNDREYGRAYECCWGHYHNCNKTRIGMYCSASDRKISLENFSYKVSGVIDANRNPFVSKDWVEQSYGITDNRRWQLSKLFGKTLVEINKIKANEGNYPVFVGIRWGFAKLVDGRLFKTDKYENSESYDEFGRRLSMGDHKTPDAVTKNILSDNRSPATKKLKLSEKDMEDLIAADPEKYIGEPGLKLLQRQYRTERYRFDLLFEDRHGSKLIVELQKGTLDRNHTYKILDYYDAYQAKRPHQFVELMIIANRIPRERRLRLYSKGIEFKEIPENVFLSDLHSDDIQE